MKTIYAVIEERYNPYDEEDLIGKTVMRAFFDKALAEDFTAYQTEQIVKKEKHRVFPGAVHKYVVNEVEYDENYKPI
jgi:hypothetical protein